MSVEGRGGARFWPDPKRHKALLTKQEAKTSIHQGHRTIRGGRMVRMLRNNLEGCHDIHNVTVTSRLIDDRKGQSNQGACH